MTNKKETLKLRKEEEQLMTQWKSHSQTFAKIDLPSFKIAENFLRMSARGFSHLTILQSEGGLGKSMCTTAILTEEKIDWEYRNSKVTPLALYKYLYECQKKYNGKRYVVILDDVIKLLDDEVIIGMLQGATWEVNGKRMVTYTSTSKQATDVPQFFEFTGEIVILTNFVKLNEYVKALITRGNYYHLSFTYKEKMKLLEEVAKLPYKTLDLAQRNVCLSRLKHYASPLSKDLNVRTLIKTFNFHLFNPLMVDEMLKGTINDDKNLSSVKKCIELFDKDIEMQKKYFNELTGLQKSSYFHYKKKYMEALR